MTECYISFSHSDSKRAQGVVKIFDLFKLDFNDESLDIALSLIKNRKFKRIHFELCNNARCKKNPVTHVMCSMINKFFVFLSDSASGIVFDSIALLGFENVFESCCQNILASLHVSFFSREFRIDYKNLKVSETAGYHQFLPMFLKNVAAGFVESLQFYISCCLPEDNMNALHNALIDKRCKLNSISIEFKMVDGVNVPLAFYNRFMDLFWGYLPRSLQKIAFGTYPRTLRGVSPIGLLTDALKNVQLSQFTLQGFELDTNFANDVAKYIESENCSITMLDICDICFVKSSDVEVITSAIQRNKTITKLCFTGPLTTEEDAKHWQDCLSQNSTVSHVILNESFRGDPPIVKDEFFASIVTNNSTLKVLECHRRRQLSPSQEVMFASALEHSYSLVSLGLFYPLRSVTPHAKIIGEYLKRNALLVWQKLRHDHVLEYCLAMAPLHLPPYVLLWIYDWLPLMSRVSHHKKIYLIQNVWNSIHKIDNIREKKESKNKKTVVKK